MRTKLLFITTLFISAQLLFAQAPTSVPADGLVSFYSFTENANDVSANHNNGVVYNASPTTDRFNKTNSAYFFNGNNSYIEVNKNSSLDLNKFTISAWFYQIGGPSRCPGSQQILVKDPYPYNYGIYVDDQMKAGAFFNSKSASQGIHENMIAPNSCSAEQWHHIVFTQDGYYKKLYIDNALVNTLYSYGNGSVSYHQNLYIGSIFGTQNFFCGKIDDIGIWDRALTESEITNLYNAPYPDLGYDSVIYNNSITVFPNPAKDQITISCSEPGNIDKLNVKIYNALGEEVFKTYTQQNIIKINTLGNSGIYFVVIHDASNNEICTKKIVLE